MFSLFDTVVKSLLFLISFVSGTNSFPKPLSAKDEQYYLEKMAQGDIAARNTLVEHNLRLVVHIAKKYSATTRDSEDLISLGTIGLIKGINSFKVGKGTRLATYAARCIENEILMHLRATKKMQCEVSLNDPIGIDKEGNQILLMDIIGDDEEDVIDKVNFNEQVKKLYGNIRFILNDREYEIITLRYGLKSGKCQTQSQIASKLNISRSYVSRIEKKALQKLKCVLSD